MDENTAYEEFKAEINKTAVLSKNFKNVLLAYALNFGAEQYRRGYKVGKQGTLATGARLLKEEA